MKSPIGLTLEQLFSDFDTGRKDLGLKAIQKFTLLDHKSQQAFLEPTIEFLKTRQEDGIRSWGTNILQMVGSKKGLRFLMEMLRNADREEKHVYRFTRFFALKAVVRLSTADAERAELQALLQKISKDKDEQGLIWVSSWILLARDGRKDALEKLEDLLSGQKERKRASEGFWATLATLRALREFPLPRLADAILSIIHDSEYLELQHHAIKALGSPEYSDNLDVIHTLATVADSPRSEGYLRLAAVRSLGQLGNQAAQTTLLRALDDDDAEIRFQASAALLSLFKEAAVSIVVQRTLEAAIQNEAELPVYLIEALRRIDRDRTLSTAILSKELGGEDRQRAQMAERILTELGGWAAVQRLSQRRSTLESLDKLLAESEGVVKSTFEDTIRQARLNFYFAMVVNALVVGIGLVMVVLAVMQLIRQPEKLESWIVPGGAGVLGVLVNMMFNNPRQNAREDLTALMNVNVIFLGFLRQVNEIDATFKHAYIESRDFGPDDVAETVRQIERAMKETLTMAAANLRGLKLPAEPPVSPAKPSSPVEPAATEPEPGA